jgi:hypothetical protein
LAFTHHEAPQATAALLFLGHFDSLCRLKSRFAGWKCRPAPDFCSVARQRCAVFDEIFKEYFA